MKAPAFDYARPATLDDALDLLQRHGERATILAGGQSLLPSLNMRLSSPGILVDIRAIEALRGIRMRAGVLRIGALTTHAQLAASQDVRRHAPLLSQAAPHIAHPAIRNVGTIGGSLAMADPAAELPACAVALQAQLVLVGRDGERRVPATEFYRGLYETALQPGQILVAIEIAAAQPQDRQVFLELARRHGDYAIVGVAACARRDGDVLRDVRLVLHSVADKPFIAAAAAAAVSGQRVADQQATIRAAQQALSGELQPHADLYHSAAGKLHLARVLTGRAIAALSSQDGASHGSASQSDVSQSGPSERNT